MSLVNILAGFIVLTYICRESNADAYCDYVLRRDCAIFPAVTAACGTNGVTYRNDCFLAKAYCSDNSIHKAHDGACISTTTTRKTTTKTTTTEASTAAHSKVGQTTMASETLQYSMFIFVLYVVSFVL